MKKLIAICALAAMRVAQSEPADVITMDGTGDGMFAAATDVTYLQNDDNFSVFFGHRHANFSANHELFAVKAESGSNNLLFDVSSTTGGLITLRVSGSDTVSTTMAMSTDTDYGTCVYGVSTGLLSLVLYEDGTPIEEISIVDSTDPVGLVDTDDGRILFGINWNGNTSAFSASHNGSMWGQAIWGRSLGRSGCDAMAEDPANYAHKTNPPDKFLAFDNTMTITVSGTVMDQSANNMDFTLQGNAARSADAGPTYPDYEPPVPGMNRTIFVLREP